MVKAQTLVKKKRWVPIMAPQDFNGVVLGEAYVAEPQEAVGRSLSVSLVTVTGDPSTQSLHVNFKVTGVQNNALMTEVIGFNIVTSAVRKMMRRGKEKVEDSFVVATKDGKKVRVKPILVTKGRAKGAVLLNLFKNVRNHMLKMSAGLSFTELVMQMVSRQFQKQLQDVLRKIYPLSVCEIRWASLEPTGVAITEVETLVLPVEEKEPPAEQAQA